MIDTKGDFYIGRIFDPQKGETTDQNLLYDPDDLTTHAVVVGMTGSGKTGLCIDLLEEAALNDVPALMIDPKGDITNALLHFPELLPQDFQPWVNPDDARREDKSIEQAASEAASLWRKGLEGWGIGGERIRALQNSAQFAVYTPGSDSGIPVSIMASLKSPPIPWEENRELLREKVSSTVTALLGLVGFQDIDPVQSREHILLANIFEHAWKQGRDLDLGELILQTQTPPFEKLGVFDVNTFFPEKDRFGLAMSLNNILAAPAFQVWVDGKPLDIPGFLYAPDGRPRHSVFYIAHLSDSERMFFVTLLFSAVESWMRAQTGTSSLRCIVYFDEIFGYLPPIGNPASKQPMLRMLKQARAFGVGLMLVTQNPVDIDYKALSNAGTWFIGKLQTEQDKERLLDGLQGAASGKMDRRAYDRLISRLGKRVFLLHNVHEAEGQLFQTRWAMNYLAGPLTRAQIPALNQLVGASLDLVSPPASATREGARVAPAQPLPAQESEAREPGLKVGSSTRPGVPTGADEYFLPNNLSFSQALKAAGRSSQGDVQSQGLIYRPALLAQAQARYLNRKFNLDHEAARTALVADPDRRGYVHWEDFMTAIIDRRKLDDQPDPRARFASLEAPLSEAKLLRSMEKDFLDWVYSESEVKVKANETLKVYAGPEVTQARFRQMCADEARQKRDDELDKIEKSYDKKISAIERKISREERELDEDEAELSQRKMEELGTHAENVLSLFGGSRSRRRISSSLSKRRMTEQAKADVEESKDAIEDYEEQIAELLEEKTRDVEEIKERWGEIANEVTEITVTPYKKDVQVELFGVAWQPYYLVKIGEQTVEIPGYETE